MIRPPLKRSSGTGSFTERLAQVEQGARTYAEDLLQEYTERIGPVVKSADFATQEWAAATATPQDPVLGTESISFPAHNLQIFSPEMLDELKGDMCDVALQAVAVALPGHCLLYTSPSPRDRQKSRMPSSA